MIPTLELGPASAQLLALVSVAVIILAVLVLAVLWLLLLLLGKLSGRP